MWAIQLIDIIGKLKFNMCKCFFFLKILMLAIKISFVILFYVGLLIILKRILWLKNDHS